MGRLRNGQEQIQITPSVCSKGSKVTMASFRSSEFGATTMNGFIRAASPADISSPISERTDGCWGSTRTLGLAEAGCEADSLAEWTFSPDYSRLSSRTIHQTGRKLLCWTSQVAQWVKALAAKPEVLSLIPRTHLVRGEISLQKLTSDLHM